MSAEQFKTALFRRRGFLVLAVLGGLVALFSLRYLFIGIDAAPPGIDRHLIDRPLSFQVHLVGGIIALLAAPWQFFGGWRARHVTAHRLIGTTYFLACVLSGMAGIHMAMNSPFGPVAGLGLGVLGVCWVVTVGLGVADALRGRYAMHRRWMIRSFALTLAALTLRLYLNIFLVVGVDFVTAFSIAAWLAWLPNLIAAQWVIGQGEPAAARPAKA